eukprot:363074-Chlamydomonas_euryale.AAC.10
MSSQLNQLFLTNRNAGFNMAPCKWSSQTFSLDKCLGRGGEELPHATVLPEDHVMSEDLLSMACSLA